jgi:hypothetical protein
MLAELSAADGACHFVRATHIMASMPYGLMAASRKGIMEASAGISGLGRALVQNNALLLQDAEAIQRQAQASGISFVEQLIASKKMSAEVATFASGCLAIPCWTWGAIDPSQLPKGLVDDELIRQPSSGSLVQTWQQAVYRYF